MQKFLNITLNTALELLRQPVFLIVLTGSLAFIALLANIYYFGLGDDPRMMKQSVLALIFVTGLFSAVLNASACVSREIRTGTALAVLSKPVGRINFLLAKFVGISLSLALQVGVQLLAALVSSRMAFDAYGTPDRAALGIYFGALLLGFLIAAAGNFFANRPFTSDAVLAVSGLMATAFVVLLFIPHDAGRMGTDPNDPTSYQGLDWRLVPAAVLIYFALVVLAAIALACATRLEMVATLVICSGVFLIGLMSDYYFGRAAAKGSMVADVFHTMVPNWQVFWMADALAYKKTIPWSYVVKTAAYVAGHLIVALAVALTLFEDRELN